ncbi:hypothetical protein [Empedobacter brevis]|uniref:hypothetical protein n=1 Tax=Empedobacter brevis TaxID=247 RepID=UPI0039B0BCF6
MSIEKSIKADVVIRWTILIVLSIFCLAKIINERNKFSSKSFVFVTPQKLDQQEDSSLYRVYNYWKNPIYKYDSTIIKVNYNKADAVCYAELIQKMQKNNVEKSGIKFKLNDNNTFADLTNLLQIIENENHKIFTFDFENDYLYVLKSNSDSDKIRMIEAQL